MIRAWLLWICKYLSTALVYALLGHGGGRMVCESNACRNTCFFAECVCCERDWWLDVLIGRIVFNTNFQLLITLKKMF